MTRWQRAADDRDLLLVSEHEPVKKGVGYYSRRDHDKDTGLELTLPSADAPVPTFELRDAIRVNWPARTPHFERRAEAPSADIATAAIDWDAVPGLLNMKSSWSR